MAWKSVDNNKLFNSADDYPFTYEVLPGKTMIKGDNDFKMVIPAGMFEEGAKLRFYRPYTNNELPDENEEETYECAGDIFEVKQIGGPSPRPGFKFYIHVPYTGNPWNKLHVFCSPSGDDPEDWNRAPDSDRKVRPEASSGKKKVGAHFSSFGCFRVFKVT